MRVLSLLAFCLIFNQVLAQSSKKSDVVKFVQLLKKNKPAEALKLCPEANLSKTQIDSCAVYLSHSRDIDVENRDENNGKVTYGYLFQRNGISTVLVIYAETQENESPDSIVKIRFISDDKLVPKSLIATAKDIGPPPPPPPPPKKPGQ